MYSFGLQQVSIVPMERRYCSSPKMKILAAELFLGHNAAPWMVLGSLPRTVWLSQISSLTNEVGQGGAKCPLNFIFLSILLSLLRGLRHILNLRSNGFAPLTTNALRINCSVLSLLLQKM